jgi:hypothetical protein
MANANIASIGRFSSQMLTYLGTQRTVQLTGGGQYSNTYKYATGPTVFPSPDSYQQAFLGGGVNGEFSPNSFDSVKCFFMSRGASVVYAETMAALAIDIAAILGVSPQSFLERTVTSGQQLMLTDDAYRAFNDLRDPGNQVGVVTTVNNKFSLQARQIRA